MKENLTNSGFVVSTDHRVKLKESENGAKYPALTREQKVFMEHEGYSDTTYNWWNKGLVSGLEELKTCERAEVIQTTAFLWSVRIGKRVQGNLKRLAVISTHAKEHQLTLMRKILIK